MSVYEYEHTDRDGDRLTVQQASEGAIWVGVNYELTHLPADKRREAAQALAGEVRHQRQPRTDGCAR